MQQQQHHERLDASAHHFDWITAECDHRRRAGLRGLEGSRRGHRARSVPTLSQAPAASSAQSFALLARLHRFTEYDLQSFTKRPLGLGHISFWSSIESLDPPE